MKILEAWNKDKRIDIIWVVLSPEFREEMISELQLKFDITNLKEKQALHHVTLAFKPKPEQIEMINKWAPENDPITIKIIENCWNQQIQALKVRIFNKIGEELTLPNQILHITASAAKGVAPKLSNDMLIGQHNSEPFKNETVGTIRYEQF